MQTSLQGIAKKAKRLNKYRFQNLCGLLNFDALAEAWKDITTRKKLKKSLTNFKGWCKDNRNKRLRILFKELNAKLRGYYNYYGLVGNYASLQEFHCTAIKIVLEV